MAAPGTVEILAIAAHRDDVEQTCGGTLLKMAELGHSTGILDLTRGEMGTRGSLQQREQEADEAARILKVCSRQALDIPDAQVENNWVNRLKVAAVIRSLTPRVVILPYWKGRHPDHYTASVLGYEACFLAGLKKLNIRESLSREGVDGSSISDSEPHRPFKIIYASLYYDVRPTFVVDITDQFEARLAALLAYKSQFSDQQDAKDIFPAHNQIRDRIDSMARFYGMLGGVKYAEPFVQKEVGLVDDLLSIPVKSI